MLRSRILTGLLPFVADRREPLRFFVLLLTFALCIATTVQAQVADPEVQLPLRIKGDAQPAIAGLTPNQVRTAYGFAPGNSGSGQTIAIVVAYDHHSIEEDLEFFSQTFGLPSCTSASGCFRKIYASGQKPGTNTLWALETALDVQWAHAMAPLANIILVEAKTAKLSDMMVAVDAAVATDASVISMSWGLGDSSTRPDLDFHFLASNKTFVAASGDFGNFVFYPSASPHVVSVGGTTLSVAADGTYLGETAWSGSGGGLSISEPVPSYQAPFNPFDKRGTPDVAYNGDPDTGFATYTSIPYFGFKGWLQIGGTSAGTPQWSALIASANSARVNAGKSPLTGSNAQLYIAAAKKEYKTNYRDVTSGSNDLLGTCDALCDAAPGYDFVTGLGTPKASALIEALTQMP